MKRILFFSLGLTLFLAITGNAYAVCQTCKDANTIDGMCWTIGACEMGATMGACVERVSFTGAVTCDSIGSQPGPECNGKDASCNTSGGGGGGGGISDPGMGGT